MRLTVQTDYALRLLMLLAASDDQWTIDGAARFYGVSKNHMMKVAQRLTSTGVVVGVRGRAGGLRLARAPSAINVGAMVRIFEETGYFVECFDTASNGCAVSPACGLRHVLNGGVQAFLAHLDRFTLADLVREPQAFLNAGRLPDGQGAKPATQQ